VPILAERGLLVDMVIDQGQQVFLLGLQELDRPFQRGDYVGVRRLADTGFFQAVELPLPVGLEGLQAAEQDR